MLYVKVAGLGKHELARMTWQGLPEGDKDLCLIWAEEKLDQVQVYKALLK